MSRFVAVKGRYLHFFSGARFPRQKFVAQFSLLSGSIANIAAYKFVEVGDPVDLKNALERASREQGLRGSIIVAPEGVNICLAGESASVNHFVAWLQTDARFADISIKPSTSHVVPFKQLKVKVKPEIITMRTPDVYPSKVLRAPAIAPSTLRRWLDNGAVTDDGQRIVLLDTRNSFEFSAGSFEGAIQWGLHRFSAFPEAARNRLGDLADAAIVTFCTGGIRCEKAALHLEASGHSNKVFQLDGGILGYFESCGGVHYRGNCVVFYDRAAVDPALVPVSHETRQAIYHSGNSVCWRDTVVVPAEVSLAHACLLPLVQTF